jgi:hypothetical protein
MSMVYSLDASKSMAFAIWDGVISAEEWSQSITAFLAEPELQTVGSVIVDAQHLTDDSSITDADIDEYNGVFARVLQATNRMKFALVTGYVFGKRGKVEHALMCMGVVVVIFNLLETACIYLDIPLQETQRTLDELRARVHPQEVQ